MTIFFNLAYVSGCRMTGASHSYMYKSGITKQGVPQQRRNGRENSNPIVADSLRDIHFCTGHSGSSVQALLNK